MSGSNPLSRSTRGVDVTATEINTTLDGATVSATELNVLDVSSSSGVIVARATGTLTAAQINDLKDTNITAIAAPGAGLAVVPLWIHIFHDHGGTDFIQAAGTDHLALRYGTADTEITEIGTEAQCTALVEASADAGLFFPLILGYVPEVNSVVEFDNNGATDYTTGDGVFEWTISYAIVTAA